MTSIEVAELTGKEHKNILADIRDESKKLEIQGIRAELIFQPGEYLDKNNQARPMYILSKEGVLQLAARYDAVVRFKLIEKVTKTEKTKLPQTYKEALLELVAQVEENEKLQLENKTLNDSLHYKQDIIDGMTNSVPVYEKQHILSRVVKHKGSNFQQRWSEIYKIFQETHHVNLKARKEGYNKTHSPKIKSTLQYAVNTGYLDALYDISTKL